MPYFRFRIPDEDHIFECKVESLRCSDQTKAGTRCKRQTVIGSPYCSTHLVYNHGLQIKQSTIPNAGKGLFAVDPRKNAEENKVIFKSGQRIVVYHGERISEEELVERYSDKTGPYAVEVSNVGTPEGEREYEDGACKRCIGSIANTKGRFSLCNARLAKHQGQIRVMATKNIRNGQEIFVWYGDEYELNEPGVEFATTAK